MAAKTAKADEKLMDIMERSNIPGLGLLAAEVIDIKENQKDNYPGMMKKMGTIEDKLDAFISAQTITNSSIAVNAASILENASSVKENAKMITDVRIKNTVVVAVITAISTVTGGALVAWLTGIF